MNANGRFVAYANRGGVFIFDRVTGASALASPSRPGAAQGASGTGPRISADGRTVIFTSGSPDLVAGDLNGTDDAYLFTTAPVPGGPVPIPACTLLDTRRRADRPALHSNVRRTVRAGGVCGVPPAAKSITANLTVLQPTGKGNLRLYAGNAPDPSGIFRFEKNQTRSGAFTIPLAANGTFDILPFVGGNGTVQAVVEVNGYVR